MEETVASGVNNLWVLVISFLIFFMHAGFAMLEAGQVRSKNVANQLTKNMFTWSLGVLVYFLVGAGISGVVGGNPISEAFGYINGGSDTWIGWLFGAVFAMTAATIVSGAVAGRVRLSAYLVYTVALAGIIYPVVAGLTWAGGFLNSSGFMDFAGGMIVHGMGGIAGLTAAFVIGPRVDHYNEDGTVNVIPGHSIAFAVLGTLILSFGWYGFNVGTAATVFTVEAGELTLGAFKATVGRVALTTTLGMAAGALGAGIVSWFRTGKVDTLYVANGMLAGLVGITSNTDAITWIGGIAIGFLAGAQLPLVFRFVDKILQIDDVCAVFPVHGSSGLLGTLLFPLFAVPGSEVSFLAQLLGVVVIMSWTVASTAAVFGLLRLAGMHRVNEEHERRGLDRTEHGIISYPEFRPEPQ